MRIPQWQKGRQPRRLLCFSAAFFAAALIFSRLFVRLDDPILLVLLAAAALCGIALAAVLLLREQFVLFRALFLGLLAGFLWCGGFLLLIWQPTQKWDGITGEIRLELTEYASSRQSYGVAEGLVTQIDGQDCRLKVKVYLLDGSPEDAPGDVLEFSGTLTAVERSFDANLLQEGIFLTLSQETAGMCSPAEAMTLLRRARILSRSITLRVQELLPGDEGTLLAALLSGERERFSDAFDRALTASGTRHITAVSGLHVTVLAGLLISLLGKKLGLLAAAPVGLIYAAVVGFSPSVVRAVVLLVLWASSFWLKLEKDPLTAFALALLLLTAANPFSCRSAGLLLSFGATLGLILLQPQLNELWIPRIKNIHPPLLKKLLWYAAGTVASTLAATLFTLLLTIVLFDTVPLLGLLSNLLILWLLSFTMSLGLLTLGVSLIAPWTAAFLAQKLLIWPLRWIVAVIRRVGALPFAATDSGNLLLLTGLVLLTAALLWRWKRLSGKGLLLLAVGLICLTGLWTAAELRLTGQVEIRSVGGQPVILLRGEGVSLINTGANGRYTAERTATALSRWNAVQLETLLCTTDDYRTQSGLRAVLEAAPTERILLPGDAETLLSADLSEQPIWMFGETGAVTVSGFRLELLAVGEQRYGLRISEEHFSLLSLCGLKAAEAREVIERYPGQAELLLVDDTVANDWQLLYGICQTVSPEQLVITTNGYSEHGEWFAGVPVTLLQKQELRFRFWR